MKKKLVSVLLTAAMVASLVGCGGGSDAGTQTPAADSGSSSSDSGSAPAADNGGSDASAGSYQLDKLVMVVDGTLTATVDNGQADFEKQWEDAVGVDLEIQQLDHSGYFDAVGRLFAGGDYPDVLIMSADMYAQYAPTGLLWDMTEAYENAAFQARMDLPGINESKKINGRLYGFSPYYGNGCVTYVKKAWLDALGIDPSTITDYASYYDMLKRFHDEDPDGNGVNGDTYGVVAAGFIGTEAPWVNYLPEFWQDAYPALYEKDGTWVDGFQEQATKDALVRLRQAYVDGAIDPETLTASTKIAREKWFSNDQTGSSGVFTYWAGTWYQTLTDNLIKNEVDAELVQLPPIKEVGAYLNREAPVWVIIDDGDGDNAREQAIFDAFFETMMDGDVVQTLWTYGAEDVHWSTKAETFKTNEGTENEATYEYADGEFHLKQSPNDPNSIWKKNHIDPALVVCHLTNGFEDNSSLAAEGNKFFSEHLKDAPLSPASETFTNESGTIFDAKMDVVTRVVVNGEDVDTVVQERYVNTVGSIIDQCLAELNG